MTYALVAVAIAAFALSAVALLARVVDARTLRALEDAQAENKQLEQAIVYLMDDESAVNVRVALPGAGEVIAQQRKEIEDAQWHLAALRKENEELQATLVEVLDPDKEVLHQIRVPGKRVDPPPNRTPCGSLCRHSYWLKATANWRCRAYQGYVADEARRHFLDADNQCVMFERKK